MKKVYLLVDKIKSGLDDTTYKNLTGEPNIHVITKTLNECINWKNTYKSVFNVKLTIIRTFDKKYDIFNN